MVSSLWKACSEGDLQRVQELLVESSGVDIEVKGEGDLSSVSYTSMLSIDAFFCQISQVSPHLSRQ
jgi:hypothetical protein